jgi:hypothetical protein
LEWRRFQRRVQKPEVSQLSESFTSVSLANKYFTDDLVKLGQ